MKTYNSDREYFQERERIKTERLRVILKVVQVVCGLIALTFLTGNWMAFL